MKFFDQVRVIPKDDLKPGFVCVGQEVFALLVDDLKQQAVVQSRNHLVLLDDKGWPKITFLVKAELKGSDEVHVSTALYQKMRQAGLVRA